MKKKQNKNSTKYTINIYITINSNIFILLDFILLFYYNLIRPYTKLLNKLLNKLYWTNIERLSFLSFHYISNIYKDCLNAKLCQYIL